MISAILYKSSTGSCERYAREMSRKLAIPSYPVDRCPLPKGMEVVYIGWLMNGKVTGLEKARRRYEVRAVVQVGMSPPDDAMAAQCRKKNDLGERMPVFTLQGAFHMEKLPPLLRMVMKKVNPGIVKRLEQKGSLTDAERATLTMARSGEGEPATWDGIQKTVDWVKAQFNAPRVIKWHEP